MAQPTAPPVVNVQDLFSLTGKTAIVTGGTGGLGMAMTVALASAGAEIISVEIPDDPNHSTLASTIQAAGRKLHQYHCDVKDSKSVRETYARIWSDGHKGDILLNCAGIQRRAEAEDFTDEQVDDVLDINLKATVVSCQEFAKPLLREGRGGKIINAASIISFIGGRNITPYAASKGGVLQVTKAFSNEWAGKGIQVNCVCHGYFRTALTDQYINDPKYKDFNDYVMMRTPANCWGEPTDLAGAVIFLASKASDFVSGTPVIVDGGWTGN